MEENNQGEKKNKATSQLCFVKMLVNNLVAGSVIGKNGSIITSIENKTGCSLKLSPTNSYFPNTQERVLVLCGKQEQINNALLIILDKIRQITTQNFQDKQNMNTSPKYTCRIVVPKSAVSAIIGKGGQQIKQLQDTTGAKIQISSREDGLNERIISIIGPFESISDTAIKVTNSIQNDPNLKDLLNVIYSKDANMNGRSSLSQNFVNQVPLNGYVVPQQYGVFQHEQYMDVNMMNSLMRHSRDLFNLPCEISIQIPDEFIGSVIGKNGARLTNIMNSTGAQIRISRKGELVPGTADRKVRIMGTVAAVHAAHVLLLQRLESVYMQLRTMQVKCDA
ncbi:RNA-binding protein Nova-1, putative [Plasmodium vivax]|uniref:RNA-binding protein Nova-1, putative n=6 Tax=Plasmodium vivax TaxID=5855 RepID=A5K176_PLAVS|nr:RNA-binding protein Nova-1, putative [Plasmodium vivax]KMZ78263.1 RNA-binding protein Nova-1 [Plasmodium vivax India VII]KMZ83868.1 RNA-binding protein Nova-1 [Plasmodium vivax Brazil I]KMZ90705.1 RNA-binding protein Nova-1 [Plasmodium vivax Mauritania I]KMZ97390.1 RNA-binding protein Nova-1 [Plasmodium vivax North Korean]EDL47073.1 RNA-binding protein Nova-1, putative [Plasmodium vivax]|eukprot:XP_001616800.1 RNA-binding protein Nova-1 [Plasmodium vivax Sal-1]